MSLSKAKQIKRLDGIGGSDIAGICGLDKFKSGGDVWMNKLGLRESPENFHTKRGTFLERGFRDWWNDITPYHTVKSEALQHPKHPLLWATPDGLSYKSKKDLTLLRTAEFKSPGEHTEGDWGERGSDQVPAYYVPQLMFEAACAGVPVADCGAYIGGDLVPYHVPFNGALFEELARIGIEWWEKYVVTKTPPPPEATEAYGKFLSKRFPVSIGTIIIANAEMEDAAERLRVARSALEKAEKDNLLAENAMKLIIGDMDGVQGPFGKVTWKIASASAYVDWEGLATALNPTPQQIAEFVRTRPGSRRFIVPRSWKKEDSSGQADQQQADTGTANADTEQQSGDGEASA